MTATFELSETNGATVVTDGITNLNYGSTDAADLSVAAYPVSAGNNSYEKYIRCHFTGTFNQIDNIQIWKSSGDYVTGEGIDTNLKTSSYVQSSFAAPVATESIVATTEMPTSDPGASNLGISGSLSGSLTSEGYSDYWVSQAQSTASTPAGDGNRKTFTIQYDEQ